MEAYRASLEPKKRKRRTKAEIEKARTKEAVTTKEHVYTSTSDFDPEKWQIGHHHDKYPKDVPVEYFKRFIKSYEEAINESYKKLFYDRYIIAKAELKQRRKDHQ